MRRLSSLIYDDHVVRSNERGTITVLVALMMAVLLGFAALAIDGGMLFLTQERLQNGVDAAVLAGAQDLPLHPDQALTDADAAANANGIPSSMIQLIFNSAHTTIQANAAAPDQVTFAKIFGAGNQTVTASAEVDLNPLTSATGVIPLGVDAATTLTYGAPVQLKAGTATYGNFGALALSGPGASIYRTDLEQGFQQRLQVGDVINTQTGDIAGPTEQAIGDRMSLVQGSATYYDYPPNCPLVVLVPVYTPIDDGGNQVKQVTIVGFASFFIESVSSSSDGAVVTGRFIQTAALGTSSSTQSDFGTYGYRLVK